MLGARASVQKQFLRTHSTDRRIRVLDLIEGSATPTATLTEVVTSDYEVVWYRKVRVTRVRVANLHHRRFGAMGSIDRRAYSLGVHVRASANVLTS